ncbi:hypothetical protein PHAVU_008G026200 [Phaseolus vulgaris]|uniref:Uncharacterized protein n=1 Tax=Phaseolus vulgaris TaxID=3885 RepID=V7B0Q2_PHAVU|nr:hypothetical protein PHAVU_008G026200g [Phaseolus vulgaris]ESW11394.1 hypothetical protein PHAVU_008G026200g [Phaseolus vulgaris]
MGEINVQTQNEVITAISPRSTATQTPHKYKCPSIAPSQPMHEHADHTSVVEPTDLYLNNTCCRCQPPCSAVNNPMKRRSPPSSSVSGEPSAKKLFCDQEDLSLCGFSAVPVPLNLNSLVNKRRSFPVLRRCVSDPYRPPAPAPAPPTPAERGSGLPPLPPGLRRSVSDVSAPSPCLNSEETAAPDSVKLRRMKERLKEMRQWWDEVMKDEEEDEKEENCVAAEEDKVLPQDDLGGEDSEEEISVEWAEQCLSLRFRCPCGKGYEVLFSENNCYYKLL